MLKYSSANIEISRSFKTYFFELKKEETSEKVAMEMTLLSHYKTFAIFALGSYVVKKRRSTKEYTNVIFLLYEKSKNTDTV